jgi:glycerol-3-phosphate acyltransferase PlsY
MDILILTSFLVASYLVGSVPFGLIYSLVRGVDIRRVGSKNIGATNVSREFGFFAGFLPVFLLDMLKGATPVFLAGILFIHSPFGRDTAMVLSGVMAILGHMFPVYLGFEGGKGVATSLGVFLPIVTYEVIICSAVFLITLFAYRLIAIKRMPKSEIKSVLPSNLIFKDLSKGVGLSSCMAALFFPVTVLIIDFKRTLIFILSILIALLVIIRHRTNLVNYIKGNG